MRTIVTVLLVSLVALIGCAGGEEQADTSVQDEPEAATEVAEKAAEEATDEAGETEDEADAEQAALNKPDPAGTYGAGISLTKTVAIATIHSEPETYEGKNVLVEGTIKEVCPRRGCWVDLVDEETKETIRVKVTDGYIVFPLSAKGKHARVEGMVEKLELTEEQARSWKEHEAEEKGETFDPASVTGPMVIWRIKGQGAEIKG
jgi:hypothetical protein